MEIQNGGLHALNLISQLTLPLCELFTALRQSYRNTAARQRREIPGRFDRTCGLILCRFVFIFALAGALAGAVAFALLTGAAIVLVAWPPAVFVTAVAIRLGI